MRVRQKALILQKRVMQLLPCRREISKAFVKPLIVFTIYLFTNSIYITSAAVDVLASPYQRKCLLDNSTNYVCRPIFNPSRNYNGKAWGLSYFFSAQYSNYIIFQQPLPKYSESKSPLLFCFYHLTDKKEPFSLRTQAPKSQKMPM